MKNCHSPLVTIVLATLACLMSVPISVSAAERRISGLSCVQVDPNQIGGIGEAPPITDAAHYVNGAVRGAPGGLVGVRIQCPVTDDDAFPKSAVRVLNIRGRSTGTVSARACSRTLDNFFTCTDFVTTQGTPDFGLIMDDVTLLPAWGPEHVNEFGFVEVIFEVPTSTEPNFEEQFRLNRADNFISGIFLSTVGD